MGACLTVGRMERRKHRKRTAVILTALRRSYTTLQAAELASGMRGTEVAVNPCELYFQRRKRLRPWNGIESTRVVGYPNPVTRCNAVRRFTTF